MKIGVIGAGTMGRGIAQLILQSGFEAVLYDISPQAVAAASEKIKEGLEQAERKGKIPPGKTLEFWSRLSCVSLLEHLNGADIVIEAIFENLKMKQELFRELSRHAAPGAVLATNTSALPVAMIANAVKNPERFIGMHFFNPPYAMKLVELVHLPATDPRAFDKARAFVQSLGRTAVKVKDTPGFIVNRVLRPFYLESMRAAEEGGGCFTWIDKACREQGQVPMGPFELTDLIGQDINLATTRSVWEGLGKPERFRPSPLQEFLVENRQWGIKTGAGFYLYSNGSKGEENPALLNKITKSGISQDAAAIWERVMSAIAAEAQILSDEKAASKEDIDTALKLGAGFPQGPFEWKDSLKKGQNTGHASKN